MKTITRRTVAVTGLHNADSGVAVLRALCATAVVGEWRVGLAANALDEGVYATDVLDEAFVLGPVSDGALFVQRLRELALRVNVSVLLATSAADVAAIVPRERQLREVGVSTFLPTPSQLALLDPVLTDRVASDAHIDVPKTVVLSSARQITRLHEELAYPVVLRTADVTAEARTLDELCIAFQRVAASGLPAVAQERASGAMVHVVGLGDGQGRLVGAVAAKVLRWEGPHSWGMTTIACPPAISAASAWAATTHWRGAFELRIELARGRALLRDVRAHLPAWIHLATSAGVNLPRAAVRLALRLPPECSSEYAVGVSLVRGSADRVVSARQISDASALGDVVRKRQPIVLERDFRRAR